MEEDKEILILHVDRNEIDQPNRTTNGSASPWAEEVRLRQTSSSRLVRLVKWAKFQRKNLVAALFTTISSTSILILFPEYLELITEDPGDKSGAPSDGYSVALVLTTVSTTLFLLLGVVLEVGQLLLKIRNQTSIFYPEVSRASVLKIGISTGLSLLTLCYAWEDDKVRCNMQLPLLGLVFLFASITQVLCQWKAPGYRRSIGMLAVIGGVFLSVDFSLMDHEHCRGVHPPPKDIWSWKVHLVWTLAFVVAIWLWTIAVFGLEAANPVKSGTNQSIGESEMCMRELHSNAPFETHTESETPYTQKQFKNGKRVSLVSVYKSLLWFHVATWTVVLSLFWTEFVPGFGKVLRDDDFNIAYSFETAVRNSFGSCTFWILIASAFMFTHSFTYLVISLDSPLVAIGFKCIGFPCVTLWWSVFRIQSPFLVWMPVATELIYALIGLPLIVCGTFYLYILLE